MSAEDIAQRDGPLDASGTPALPISAGTTGSAALTILPIVSLDQRNVRS